MRIGVMKDSKTKDDSGIYTSHRQWVVPFLLSYILRDVSFAEVSSVCRVALREPMLLFVT